MSADRPPEGFDPAYLVTLDEIYHGAWATERKLRIDQFRELLAELWPAGHPSNFIHVTGTNGKGSVCHYLAQGLALAGPTGSWTGPHVFDYAERIHIGARPIEHAHLVEIYRRRVDPVLRQVANRGARPLGFAEIGILIALHAFEDLNVRWAMMEVGVGGRYTPLRALPQTACVLTNVGGDHPQTLGTELWQRATEKAGLVAPDGTLFTAADGEALGFVAAAARAEDATVHIIGEAERKALGDLLETAPGGYEASNLALASAVISHLEPEIDRRAAVEAMTARLTARFERASGDLIVDIAHNADKVAALATRLAREFPHQRFVLVIGLTRERDPLEVFAPLLPLAREIIITTASYAGQNPEAIAERLSSAAPHGLTVRCHTDPRQALAQARAAATEGTPVVLTGSGYTIDQTLNPNPYLRHMNASFGWRGTP